MPLHRPWLFCARWLVVIIAVGVWLGAQDTAHARPSIPPGKESVLQELARPHTLGTEVKDGWYLHQIDIARHDVTWVLSQPPDKSVTLRIEQNASGDEAEDSSESFVATYSGDDESGLRAAATLFAAIRSNDDGSFWDDHGIERSGGAAARVVQPGAEVTDVHVRPPSTRSWIREVSLATVARDGGVQFLGLVLCIFVLTIAALRRTSHTVKAAVFGAVVAGILVRWYLAPAVALAPWPYSRVIGPITRIIDSRMFGVWAPSPLAMVDLVPNVTRAYAFLAPLAMFVHARYLLGRVDRALAAAVMMAFLPLHIRFSASDVGFIPSITICATAFALIHAGTRAKFTIGRIAALLGLALALILVYEARPLNILYAPLLVAACFLPGSEPRRRGWVIAATVLVLGVTLGVGIPQLLSGYGREVNDGLSPAVLLGALRVIFSPSYNILVNPAYSPPLFLAAAVYGTARLWKSKERSRGLFLVGWLGMFLVAHGYVVPYAVANQARYHLHLVSPYILLGSCGIVFFLEARSRRWLIAAVAYCVCAPVVHHRAMTDVNFLDQREYLFVKHVRTQIPSGCTVLEYAGPADHDARFGRMGRVFVQGHPVDLWTVKAAFGELGDESGDPAGQVREILRAPPQCLFIYQGLPCYGYKKPEQPIHPACQAMVDSLETTAVAQETVIAKPYDGAYSHGLRTPGEDPVTFRLLRATSRAERFRP